MHRSAGVRPMRWSSSYRPGTWRYAGTPKTTTSSVSTSTTTGMAQYRLVTCPRMGLSNSADHGLPSGSSVYSFESLFAHTYAARVLDGTGLATCAAVAVHSRRRSGLGPRKTIPMRARVVACLLQLATVDLTLRRYDTDGRRSDEHRAARKPALSVQRKRRDCPARTTIPPRDLQR